MFQCHMVFMTPGMLSIADAANACHHMDQNHFQSSGEAIKVNGLCSLTKIIIASTYTLNTTLTNILDPTACNYYPPQWSL